MQIASEFAKSLAAQTFRPQLAKEYSFEYWADRFFQRQSELVHQGLRHPQQQRNDATRLYDKEIGLTVFFRDVDIRAITTKSYIDYITFVRKTRPTIKSSSTFNHLTSCFRKVLKEAMRNDVITRIVDTPREERKEQPRVYLPFYPLVSEDNDDYKLLLATADKLSKENRRLPNGHFITRDLYEFILWQTHTFMRPTVSETFGVRYEDVRIKNEKNTKDKKDIKYLLIKVKGKTGQRIVVSLPAAVSVFERLKKRPHKEGDYIFLPKTKSRTAASNFIGRMFRGTIKEAGIKSDGPRITPYCLRHTAIAMRLVNSKGRINIFSLAKNAGTSVDQIQRFYVAKLPLSDDLIRNLQTFGND